ncbi:DUF4163 domain-containing protein [Muricauda sp. JGD-17]|uniref:DUF4163 domain-containing protein n=1 Tax=Flagellimonas ochracea TaxID=2696472 RepID=A0A964WXH9_9FLAO|nr:DUF3298 and DUF4163 domain-containing protein [Allomuricauda ochracea]NAY91882.1 DUF4163 domain-containing protein [Allomuricauda ochracea]
MKKIVSLLLLLLISIGCEEEHKLTFEPFELKNKSCADCPNIEIVIPKALDNMAVANTINNALEEEIISLLSFDDGGDIESMDHAMTSFTAGFQELKSKYPDETVGWEATIKGEVLFEDKEILTLVLNAYTFTGGAHGYGSTTLLNFDKNKGTELENWELFKDLEGFEKYAETKFRIQEGIPQDANINVTGFMFEKDSFHLADNVGYTPEGIRLIYNQYEVASYADGPIELMLPYAEINHYLKRKVKL